MTDIHLDDLLPTNDEHNVESDCGTFFDTGKPCWEMADVFKWMDRIKDDPILLEKHFRVGFYAGVFELLLKTGKQFRFDVPNAGYTKYFIARAEDFNRDVQTSGNHTIIVSGYDA